MAAIEAIDRLIVIARTVLTVAGNRQLDNVSGHGPYVDKNSTITNAVVNCINRGR